MKILIISGKKYSISNRGIDIITTFLAKTHNVDHLLFYTRVFCNSKKISDNITQLFFYDSIKIYKDKFKYFMPGFIIDWVFRKMIQKSNIDFSQYDYVILESGYPILLADYINTKIIYRQSDSLEVAFNTTRLYFKKKENNLMKKAISVSSAINPLFYKTEFSNKIVFWKSGFLFPHIHENLPKKNLIVYMGGVPIDYYLVKTLAERFLDYEFVIVGNHKDKIHKKNVIFTGFLDFDAYKNYVIQSKVFFYPIANSYLRQLKMGELTSKFYLPLALGIPFVTHSYGTIINNDIEKKILVYKSRKEAIKIFDDIIYNNKYQDFCITKSTKDFLDKQTIEQKNNELNDYFLKIFESKESKNEYSNLY